MGSRPDERQLERLVPELLGMGSMFRELGFAISDVLLADAHLGEGPVAVNLDMCCGTTAVERLVSGASGLRCASELIRLVGARAYG